MAVVYKEHPLASFLRELPTLVLQYKQQMDERDYQERMYEKKLKADERIRAADRLYTANLEHYKEAKLESGNAEKQYDAAMEALQTTGANLELVNELLQTTGAKQLLSLSQIDAQNYALKAETHAANAEYYDERTKVLKDVLYDEVAKASAVMSGGDPALGKKAGGDPLAWDPADFGFQAFSKMFPLADDAGDIDKTKHAIAESVFLARPDISGKSAATFQAADIVNSLNIAKKDALDAEDAQDKATEEANIAREFFATSITNSDSFSGRSEYYQYTIQAANVDGNYDDQTVENAKEYAHETMMKMATDIAELRGLSAPETIEQANIIYKPFDEVHQAALGRYATGGIGQSKEDYTYFQEFASEVYRNYITKSDVKKKELDRIARDIFGYTGITFEEYYKNLDSHVDSILIENYINDLDDDVVDSVKLKRLGITSGLFDDEED